MDQPPHVHEWFSHIIISNPDIISVYIAYAGIARPTDFCQPSLVTLSCSRCTAPLFTNATKAWSTINTFKTWSLLFVGCIIFLSIPVYKYDRALQANGAGLLLMATAIVPLLPFECSTLQHVHLSSMHLCCCRYVSIACMANPPPQFQSTHGRGRIQGTPLANMRHQQDIRGGTLANMRHQRINKCTVQHRHSWKRPAHPCT